MFVCPSCKTELNQTTGERGILWVCPKCKGRAMNVSLLRRLVEQRQFNRVWQTAWDAAMASERKCPSCQKLMIEVPVNPPPDPLVLDVCKACQFVWFDPSEFEKMAVRRPPVPAPELPPEAKQILAEHKVKLLAERRRQEETTDSWITVIESILHIP